MATPTTDTGKASAPATGAQQSGSNSRIVVITHVAAGIVLYYIASGGLSLLWASAGWPSPRWLGVARPPIAIAIGVSLAGIGILATNTWIQDRLNEVINELRKVTWPSWKETRQTTLVVMAVAAIIAVILGAWDFVFSGLIQQLLGMGTKG